MDFSNPIQVATQLIGRIERDIAQAQGKITALRAIIANYETYSPELQQLTRDMLGIYEDEQGHG